jgi:hypothetical protein
LRYINALFWELSPEFLIWEKLADRADGDENGGPTHPQCSNIYVVRVDDAAHASEGIRRCRRGNIDE